MSTQSTDCFICGKHQGEIIIPGGVVYEDDVVYVGHVYNPEGLTYLGYLIAETKRHTPGLAELTDEEAQALGLLVTRISRALKKSEGVEHIYAFVLGNAVPHMHVHVVPRYPGTPREYWGTKITDWSEAPHGDSEEIETLCTRLRIYLQSEG